MSATISSIHYCPVKSISFQNIKSCQIKKNVGIIGDRIFAFSKGLNIEQAKTFEKDPDDRRGMSILANSILSDPTQLSKFERLQKRLIL